MKTVLITGAAGGLGTTVTNYFLNKDYQVIATVSQASSKEQLPAHERLQVETIDLQDESKTTALVQQLIDQHGRIDAALLLVGGFTAGSIAATSSADIHQQIALNFDTAYHVARPLFEHMLKEKKGRLVFIGSRPALSAPHGKSLLAYALSKSLLFKLAEYMNEEARGTNVTVTVVAPSTIDTPANRKSMPKAKPEDWVSAEALAGILEFIVSDQSLALRETVLKVYNNS
jgi:NAD(P)-dependent dehydrogenase (short-subunit alcohol dehydrogenase family)